jgi:hypothetical protein
MRLPREVKIIVRPDGKVEVETFGFVGKSCQEVSEFLEKLLAGDDPDESDVQRDFKPEYLLAEQEEEMGLEDRNP